ncbi:MAG: GntR family transcriptional regulator [Spirochaetales bacterium]|nr:GntR family transcriptional regulator [Spirochaetales bacterium]
MQDKEDFLVPLFAKTSRAENVYEAIRRGIISGYWKAGDRINDAELAKRYGVSRLSVREALSKLVESRILEKEYWKGYYVRKISLDEFEAIFEIRQSLEKLALHRIMASGNTAVTSELKKAVDKSESDLKSGNSEEFMKSDFTFHEILYRESGNPWIPYILSITKILIDIFRTIEKGDEFEKVARTSISEHRAVIEMIKKNDEKKAMESLDLHLKNHKERVYREYKKQAGK